MPGVPIGTAGESGDWVYFDGGKIGAKGDPHIFTINNELYDHNRCGYFRFFDNNNSKDRFLINCEIKFSKFKRWKTKMYFTKLFIKFRSKILILDMGFRGERVEILYNDGFNFDEIEEVFSSGTYDYCNKCSFSTLNISDVKKHAKNKRHRIIRKVKNILKLKINNDIEDQKYSLELENVNNFNLQPCRINFNIENKDRQLVNSYSGIVVDKKWSFNSEIDTLCSINKIKISNDKLPLIIRRSKNAKILKCLY
jgi:hypothetical protein